MRENMLLNDHFLNFMIGFGIFWIIFAILYLVLLLLYGEDFPYVIRDKIQYNRNRRKKTKEKMEKQYFVPFKVELTGQTASGETQSLEAEVRGDASPLSIEAEQEYILINKLSEAGIEIKARFIDEEIPTDKAKFLFMLGEACYAATFKFYAPESEEVETSEQREKLFENFMEDLTEAVKDYHKLN